MAEAQAKAHEIIRGKLVHDFCNHCGTYYRGIIFVSEIALDQPDKSAIDPTIHFIILCRKCGKLVNLVSIEKEVEANE